MDMQDFQVDSEMRNGARVVAIRGAFDLTVAAEVEKALTQAGADAGRGVVVELSECDFIDSTGLATLLSAARALPDDEPPLRLACPPSSEVRRTLELVGITLTVSTFDTVGEAITAAGSSPGAG